MTEHGGPFRPPAIETIVASPEYAGWVDQLTRPLATALVREAVATLRKAPDAGAEALDREVQRQLRTWSAQRAQPVINATGVLLHTNLGRAPLDSDFFALLAERVAGYSTLEYDLEGGERGERGLLVRRLLAELCSAEAGLVVNNCAAGVLLMLAQFRGGSVIVSRGELVQIGGGFRVPEIMVQSGVRLIETGTTNRTSLRDYEEAIDTDTAAILKVHRSNFQMTGFVESVPAGGLRDLCLRRGLALLEDLGCGAVSDLSRFGLPAERTLARAVGDGVDLVSASADKLLGGPQAGLIVGGREPVARLARHPLYRALRPGKLTLGALEISLRAHLAGTAEATLPLYRLLAETPAALAERAEAIGVSVGRDRVEIRASEAVTGGGTLPGATLPSVALVVQSPQIDAMAGTLRALSPPVIARVQGDELWLDLKTVFRAEDARLADALRRVTAA